MSQILKTFTHRQQGFPNTWWLILDCGHWYHWTGVEAPNANEPFQCPSCHPPVVLSVDGTR